MASTDIADLVHEMRSRGDAFVIATVVRTVSMTAAKPGAKAVINGQGQIIEGWVGGGCARHAVLKAAAQAIEDGQARLVSIAPEELLADQADLHSPDNTQVITAKNMCPSKGSMDIFVEPVLSNPQLVIIGDSPVAVALENLAGLFDLKVLTARKAWATMETAAIGCDRLCVFDKDAQELLTAKAHRYIVVSTQGSGDLKALELALSLESRHVGFVGSARKINYMKNRLEQQGLDRELVQRIKSPAGLDIKAVTPQEIALSIIAEVVKLRRS